jgi:hypothetical protein
VPDLLCRTHCAGRHARWALFCNGLVQVFCVLARLDHVISILCQSVSVNTVWALVLHLYFVDAYERKQGRLACVDGCSDSTSSPGFRFPACPSAQVRVLHLAHIRVQTLRVTHQLVTQSAHVKVPAGYALRPHRPGQVT